MMCQSLVVFYLLCFSTCLVWAASSAGSNDGFSHHAFSLFPANDRGQRAPAGVADSLYAVALSVCATPKVQVIRFLQSLALLIGCGYPRPGAAQAGVTRKGLSGVLALLLVLGGGVSGAASSWQVSVGGLRQA